jgi:hypothetical protein
VTPDAAAQPNVPRGHAVAVEPRSRGEARVGEAAYLAITGLDWRWLWRQTNRVAVPVVLAWFATHIVPQAPSIDDMAYWRTAHGALYAVTWNTDPASYIYSPAFAQVIAPLASLPYSTFHVTLEAVQLAAVVWLIGPAATAVFLFVPWLGGSYIWNGNLTPLLCVALVLEWWPALILTKILPGVTLGWHVGRRDWRGLAIALWLTIAIVAVSFALWPGAWFDWAGALQRAMGSQLKGWLIPLWLRLPVAAGLSVYAGRTGRRWLLAPAAMLSVADIGIATSVWLIAIPRLTTRRSGPACSP